MAQRQTGNGYFRKIDFVFYHADEIRRAVDAARNDSGGSKAARGGGIGDPTAAAAMRNVTPLRFVEVGGARLEWPDDWLRVIDSTFAWCDRDRFIVARDRYSGVDYRLTCAKLSISERSYYYMINDVRQFAAMCAAQLGVIKVC